MAYLQLRHFAFNQLWVSGCYHLRFVGHISESVKGTSGTDDLSKWPDRHDSSSVWQMPLSHCKKGT